MEEIILDIPMLLDTHILIWCLANSNNLSEPVKKVIDNATSDKRLLLSSISLWEIAMLKSKKRINIYEPIKEFLKSISEIDGLKIIDILPEIAAESSGLDDFHGDPADRIIAATALITGATLLTRDNQILSWAERGNIRAIKC